MNKLFSLPCWYLISVLFLSNNVCAQSSINSLRYIDQKLINQGNIIKGTTFGGISGIDRKSNGEYVLISDDRSEYSPARYYIADIQFDAKKIDSVYVKDVQILKKADTSLFPERSLDPESIRYKSGRIYWTSEGSRKEGYQPFIAVSDTSRNFIRNIPLEKRFRNNEEELGLRENASIEACSFSTNGKALWMTNEAPLYEDGPEATLTESKSPIRITLLNPKNGKIKKQYAYMLSKITNEPIKNGFKINSVPEILAVSDQELLILEREYSYGRGNIVKLFKVSINDATNIRKIKKLENAKYKPLEKTLLVDFSTLGLNHIDNIEGMTFGPVLANGKRTLLFVSDDNFNKEQFTQFIAFEVL